MRNSDRIYEPHLSIREFTVPPSGEWTPRFTGWTLIQIRHGNGYYLQPQLNRELETGAVLLSAGYVPGTVHASQLGGLSLFSFNVIPARLTGLITLGEQSILEGLAAKRESAVQILPARHAIAVKMNELCGNRREGGLLFRLKLLQLFVEAFGSALEQTFSEEGTSDAKKRLQVFLGQAPSSELLEMNFNDLAQTTRCTARHLSRIFHELVGMSFRDKRAELRLMRARELLATTNSKVVDVALESGYKSLSLFNLMFARRFGVSPGKWRQKNGSAQITKSGKRKRTALFAPDKVSC